MSVRKIWKRSWPPQWGDTVEGRITRLASFGAFMELAPRREGMIHLSELSWSRVNSADEAVAVGDVVRAKLLSVSKDDKGQYPYFPVPQEG